MEETYHLNGIILNRAPFRENDLKIVLYTAEKGKITLVAKGGLKKQVKISRPS
jgi:recombinational DNA repair protein (RecF pathway)